MALEHGDGAEAALEVVLEGVGGEDTDLVGSGRLRGREGGVEGIDEYLETKYVGIKL